VKSTESNPTPTINNMPELISKRGKKECAFCGEPIPVGTKYCVIGKGINYFNLTGHYHANYDTKECMTAHADEIYDKKLNEKRLRKLPQNQG